MAEVRTITISEETAIRLYKFYKLCDSADYIFHSCQNASFRQQVSACVKAPNTKAAFEELKRLIGKEV